MQSLFYFYTANQCKSCPFVMKKDFYQAENTLINHFNWRLIILTFEPWIWSYISGQGMQLYS